MTNLLKNTLYYDFKKIYPNSFLSSAAMLCVGAGIVFITASEYVTCSVLVMCPLIFFILFTTYFLYYYLVQNILQNYLTTINSFVLLLALPLFTATYPVILAIVSVNNLIFITMFIVLYTLLYLAAVANKEFSWVLLRDFHLTPGFTSYCGFILPRLWMISAALLSGAVELILFMPVVALSEDDNFTEYRPAWALVKKPIAPIADTTIAKPMKPVYVDGVMVNQPGKVFFFKGAVTTLDPSYIKHSKMYKIDSQLFLLIRAKYDSDSSPNRVVLVANFKLDSSIPRPLYMAGEEFLIRRNNIPLIREWEVSEHWETTGKFVKTFTPYTSPLSSKSILTTMRERGCSELVARWGFCFPRAALGSAWLIMINKTIIEPKTYTLIKVETSDEAAVRVHNAIEKNYPGLAEKIRIE